MERCKPGTSKKAQRYEQISHQIGAGFAILSFHKIVLTKTLMHINALQMPSMQIPVFHDCSWDGRGMTQSKNAMNVQTGTRGYVEPMFRRAECAQ